MAESAIEWTEQTWNPIVGCSVISPGCTNCYAMKMAARLERMGQDRYRGLTKPTKAGAVWTGELRLVEEALTLPLRRRKPTTWFVNSMSDLFHESVPDAWIDRVFAVMALCPQHTFQVLTKRSARMRAYMQNDERSPAARVLKIGDAAARIAYAAKIPATEWPWPLPNVWLGVSAEDQRRADERVPDLLATPAAVRFVSAEPLLGPIDFTEIEEGCTRRDIPQEYWASAGDTDDEAPGATTDALAGREYQHHGHWFGDCARLDWIIVGGESGPRARPMHPGWARQIRDACAAAGVAFHFKQHGAWIPEARGSDWMILDKDGGLDLPDHRWPDEEAGEVAVSRIGKKVAGRLLDGVEHNGMPRTV